MLIAAAGATPACGSAAGETLPLAWGYVPDPDTGCLCQHRQVGRNHR